MNNIVACYLVYLAISVTVTIWVAHVLHKRGRIFLIRTFQGDESLADSVNDLLVVGFYLVNLGYVALRLKTAAPSLTLRGSVEMVTDKIGVVLLVLGAMHFFNLYVFSRLRKRSQNSKV